ncbi:hypothetical protein Tco_1341839 [Tanacetum coccineum]
MLGILNNRLNSVSIIVSSASVIVSTGRRLRSIKQRNPTSGIRACVETLNKKNSIVRSRSTIKHVRWPSPLQAHQVLLTIRYKTVLKYAIWSMRMRQYICHTYHNLWDIIVNGDLEDEATPSGEQSSPPVPKTAKQLAARRNQERIKSILLLAIPDEYLLKFHNVPDAKSLWAAIKSRFGDIDEVRLYDLYNNLKVYEDELKRSSGSNSASQNLAFLSSENTNSTNEVSIVNRDFGVSTTGGISQVPSTPKKDILLENVDLEGVKEEDLKVKMAGAMHKQLSLHSRHWWQDGLGGYDWSNDFEKRGGLEPNYDTEREKHNKAKLEIRGYEIALESLEARILGHEKNELAWGERYEFQNYDLKCREIKINNLNLELEKVVKERDELKLKIEKWEGVIPLV